MKKFFFSLIFIIISTLFFNISYAYEYTMEELLNAKQINEIYSFAEDEFIKIAKQMKENKNIDGLSLIIEAMQSYFPKFTELCKKEGNLTTEEKKELLECFNKFLSYDLLIIQFPIFVNMNENKRNQISELSHSILKSQFTALQNKISISGNPDDFPMFFLKTYKSNMKDFVNTINNKLQNIK